ncbi:MAG: SdpI family protein [Gammaproteobacteria bacterium]
MTFKRATLLGFVLVVIAFAFALWLYPSLPNAVPIHWGPTGRVNGYAPKPWGAFIGPLTLLGIWIVFWILPRISPRGYRLEPFQAVYGTIELALLGLLLILAVASLLAADGRAVDIALVAPLTVGILFVILGNYMGKMTKNFFVGIRTPWTLASDEVWTRTHHLGGWLFVLAGLALIIEALLGAIAPGIILLTALIPALVPVVYSYVLYKRIEGFGPGTPGSP